MTSEVPLLIVTLPGRTISVLREEVELARAGGADVAEVRLDRMVPSDRAALATLFPAALPLMATLRSRAEGGEGPDDPDARRTELEAASALPFLWLDLEEARDGPMAAAVADHGHSIVVLSSHLPEGTSPDELFRRVRAAPPPGALRKVVLRATVTELFDAILPTLRTGALGSTVLLTTGPSGALLRAGAMRLRYPFVFAGLPVRPGTSSSPAVEPSQVPVDRLRWYFEGSDAVPLFGLVGRPISHSQSPYLHSRWMRAERRRGLYIALEIESEAELVDSIEPLIAEGVRGLNITHPWKAAALACATRIGRGAERCGVANCLTFRDAEIEAENTDLSAILRRLEELHRDGRWDGRELAVVGSGGAAAATLAAARETGAAGHVLARSPEATRSVAERFGATPLTADELRPFDLVVHATAVGRAGAGTLAVPLAPLIARGGRVLDWVYLADEPHVRDAALAAGAVYEDGWRLLAYQAAASFGIWWGAEPSPEEVDRTIEEGPCAA